VQDTLGSVRVALTSSAVPVAAIGQPPRTQIRSDDAALEPDLAWQSSIGQFIFLQSLAQERV
jgi:hypothetical protein